jgi:lysophospholipase L1-like esterase
MSESPNLRRQFLLKSAGLLAMPFSFPLEITQKYNISTAQTSFRILFQGDSITDGNRGRNEDPNHILGHGYAFAIAAETGSRFPERKLTFINKGVSGDKIQDLLTRWKTDCLDLNPDVVSILAGINDILGYIHREEQFDSAQFENQYRQLLDVTRTHIPQVLLVLGEPFILNVGMVVKDPERWKEMIEAAQVIVKKLAKEYNTVFVPYQSVFTEACKRGEASYWIWDGIHPTYAGHGLMKEAWLEETRKRCVQIRK